MIAAKSRGVPVRVLSDAKEYRLASRLWHAWNLDRLWAAGIPVRVPAHAGMNHQKVVILYGQHTTIFGSSNWTSPSDHYQQEHNLFATAKLWMFDWFVKQFDRKWGNSNPLAIAETKPFVPLPPDAPKLLFPASSGTGVPRTPRLTWYGGPWAFSYDVYFGKSSTPPLYVSNRQLGPSLTKTQNQDYTLPTLSAHTTYYWRVVGRTAAGKTKSSAVWTFTTGA
jgi:hypothetical protein